MVLRRFRHYKNMLKGDAVHVRVVGHDIVLSLRTLRQVGRQALTTKSNNKARGTHAHPHTHPHTSRTHVCDYTHTHTRKQHPNERDVRCT